MDPRIAEFFYCFKCFSQRKNLLADRINRKLYLTVLHVLFFLYCLEKNSEQEFQDFQTAAWTPSKDLTTGVCITYQLTRYELTSFFLRINNCLKIYLTVLVSLAKSLSHNEESDTKIASCVYTKTIILFNLGE